MIPSCQEVVYKITALKSCFEGNSCFCRVAGYTNEQIYKQKDSGIIYIFKILSNIIDEAFLQK